MYTDPWDLKHSIQQLQEEQRQTNNLISNQKNSSSTYNHQLYDDSLQHDSHYDIQSDQHEDQSNSDQNTSQQTGSKAYSKSLQNSFQEQNDVQFVEKNLTMKPRKKYGKMVVFFEIKNTFLSIGPNYLFFSFAYLCFTIASIYLVLLVNQSLQNVNFKIFNFIFCFLQNLSYLLVATSNPGVKLPQTSIMMQSQQNQQQFYVQKRRLCKVCGAIQQRKTYHCRQCDVCVMDYDHHCPWTSKCIGGGNLKRFYFFVCMTPFYIFYYVVAFMICMASLTIPHASNLKPAIPVPNQ